MKVVLLSDVKGTGKKDQIVEVSDGFARNFLFPRKLAREASAAAIQDVARKQEQERRRKLEEAQKALEQAEEIKKLTVTVRAKCGEGERLVGSITAKEIADALKEQHGIDIDRRKIVLGEPIRKLGSLMVDVRISAEASAQMKVNVIKQD